MIVVVGLSLASAGALHLARAALGRAAVRRRLPAPTRAMAPTRVTRLEDALARAAIPLSPRVVRTGWAAAGAAVFFTALLAGGVPLATLAAIVVVSTPPLALRSLRSRADELVDRDLPDALDAVSRSLRSGASLHQAVEEATGSAPGPLGDDLAAVVGRVARGASLDRALDAWIEQRPRPAVRLAASALGLGLETGGASAQAIDGVAATLRINRAVAGEVRALSSQARLSALVIALAPIGFALVTASTDSQSAAFLLRTPIGVACLAAGLTLDVVGALWMRRLAVVTA